MYYILSRKFHLGTPEVKIKFVNADCDPLYGEGSWDLANSRGFATFDEADGVAGDILEDLIDEYNDFDTAE